MTCKMLPGLDGLHQPISIANSGTPPKSDIEPGNDGLEDDFPLPGVYSQVPC